MTFKTILLKAAATEVHEINGINEADEVDKPNPSNPSKQDIDQNTFDLEEQDAFHNLLVKLRSDPSTQRKHLQKQKDEILFVFPSRWVPPDHCEDAPFSPSCRDTFNPFDRVMTLHQKGHHDEDDKKDQKEEDGDGIEEIHVNLMDLVECPDMLPNHPSTFPSPILKRRKKISPAGERFLDELRKTTLEPLRGVLGATQGEGREGRVEGEEGERSITFQRAFVRYSKAFFTGKNMNICLVFVHTK